MVLGRGKQHSNLYLTRAKVIKDAVNVVESNERIIESNDMTDLWLRRLSHINEKELDSLAKKNVLQGVKRAKLEKYAQCLAGKQRRVSFSSWPSRKSDFLQLVHSDVCAPLKVRSLGGAQYFVTFIDDYSRKIWVYTLKTKDQVLDVFKQFQVLVEYHTRKKLECIRTNNGGEYTRPFDRYCRKQGIIHKKTPPKTPQLNGMIERINMTLIERVRCLLSEVKLPRSFWGEALSTTVHVIDLSPAHSLNGDIPDKVWFDKDVGLGIPRVAHGSGN